MTGLGTSGKDCAVSSNCANHQPAPVRGRATVLSRGFGPDSPRCRSVRLPPPYIPHSASAETRRCALPAYSISSNRRHASRFPRALTAPHAASCFAAGRVLSLSQL